MLTRIVYNRYLKISNVKVGYLKKKRFSIWWSLRQVPARNLELANSSKPTEHSACVTMFFIYYSTIPLSCNDVITID